MGIQKSSPHMCSSFYEWKYDVFLSFRGEDTRNNFTDHLYAAFRKDGIKVFKDDKELEKGKFISPELSKAIEESRLSVIIFSRNYASSTWCLDELLKIVQCMKTMKQMVFPVFYDADPSDLRKQKGKFQEAFSKHEEAFKENTEKVKKWRTALTEVANISGWDLKDRPESEFIQDIIREISKRLGHNNLSTLEGLVGIDSRMEKLRMMLMSTKTDDVRMIGIYGMGGIGKTTIARAVYDLISDEFEGRGFLANVREISQKSGIYNLQRQLLSQILKESYINIWDVYEGIRMIRSRLQHKRVLIVIDDVDDIKQLNELAGKHDWFGSGSRIIITTRDKHLLLAHGVDNLYELEELNNYEARQLFSLKAFKNYYPPNEYVELSKHVVKYACGLPLALEVLGSFLFGRSIDQWNSALERLGKDYETGILDSLKISFDGLKETEKKIFLDVACFFKGKNKDYVTRILDGCGFSSTIGIAVLVDKSLITILKNDVLWMHDLLQEMGQWIVMRESPENPGECSRLWEEADVHDVLTRNTGTELIEGMMLEKVVGYFSLSGKVFSKMTKLRLLKICNVHLPEGLEYLSNNLSLLEWHGYPLKHLPSSLQLDKIVELKLQYSHIVRLWKETKPLTKLKVIDLSHSKNLIRTIDFREVPNLEELILEGCTSLCEIHQSLLVHQKLILLNLKDCPSLTALPREMDMESLKTLILTGCNKLKKFPKFVRSMECLEELFLDKTPIKELPFQVELLKGIVLLSMKDCKNLLSLPTNISSLESLKTLNLYGCSKLKNMPENLGQLELLEILDVSGTAIRQPESSIFFMKNLKELSFRGCKGPSLNSCYLPFSFRLMLGRSSNPMALKLPPLSGLSSLRILDFSDCNLEAIPGEIDSLVSLKELHLGNNNFVSLPASIIHLSKLKVLTLENCKRLQSLPELPQKLHIVSIDDCTSLETLPISLKSCKSQTWISCINCLNLLDCSIMAFPMLKKMSIPRDWFFCFIFPGSEVPKWFSHQAEGSWIRIKRNPNLKLKGFLISAVIFVHNHLPALSTRIYCRFRSISEGVVDRFRFYLISNLNLGTVSDHIWLFSLPINENNVKPRYQIEFDMSEYQTMTVKGCAVHPIYEQEAEGLDQCCSTRNLAENDGLKLVDFSNSLNHLHVYGTSSSLAYEDRREQFRYSQINNEGNPVNIPC